MVVTAGCRTGPNGLHANTWFMIIMGLPYATNKCHIHDVIIKQVGEMYFNILSSKI
jgi:hypothetical protein